MVCFQMPWLTVSTARHPRPRCVPVFPSLGKSKSVGWQWGESQVPSSRPSRGGPASGPRRVHVDQTRRLRHCPCRAAAMNLKENPTLFVRVQQLFVRVQQLFVRVQQLFVRVQQLFVRVQQLFVRVQQHFVRVQQQSRAAALRLAVASRLAITGMPLGLGLLLLWSGCDCFGEPAAQIPIGTHAIANPHSRKHNPGGLTFRFWQKERKLHLSHPPGRKHPVLCDVEVLPDARSNASAALAERLRDLPAAATRTRITWQHAAGTFAGWQLRVPVGKAYTAVGVDQGTFNVAVWSRQIGNDVVILSVGTFSVDPKGPVRARACRDYLATFSVHPAGAPT